MWSRRFINNMTHLQQRYGDKFFEEASHLTGSVFFRAFQLFKQISSSFFGCGSSAVLKVHFTFDLFEM